LNAEVLARLGKLGGSKERYKAAEPVAVLA